MAHLRRVTISLAAQFQTTIRKLYAGRMTMLNDMKCPHRLDVTYMTSMEVNRLLKCPGGLSTQDDDNFGVKRLQGTLDQACWIAGLCSGIGRSIWDGNTRLPWTWTLLNRSIWMHTQVWRHSKRIPPLWSCGSWQSIFCQCRLSRPGASPYQTGSFWWQSFHRVWILYKKPAEHRL